jgi:hypothetical protein
MRKKWKYEVQLSGPQLEAAVDIDLGYFGVDSLRHDQRTLNALIRKGACNVSGSQLTDFGQGMALIAVARRLGRRHKRAA